MTIEIHFKEFTVVYMYYLISSPDCSVSKIFNRPNLLALRHNTINIWIIDLNSLYFDKIRFSWKEYI